MLRRWGSIVALALALGLLGLDGLSAQEAELEAADDEAVALAAIAAIVRGYRPDEERAVAAVRAVYAAPRRSRRQ